MRVEKDQLGEICIENISAYGIQTARAGSNFQISGNRLKDHPEMVGALAMVKHACARANYSTGVLSEEKADQITTTAREIIEGQHHEHFIVDMIQGGAGTSSNMNSNEVIANISLQRMGHGYGNYKYLHPNDDVNRSQSTNDVYPTAIRLALLNRSAMLLREYELLIKSIDLKALEFSNIVKVGRTQLQDAVPMTFGEEFSAFSAVLSNNYQRISQSRMDLSVVNLGGTAVGSGISAPKEYRAIAIEELSTVSGFNLVSANNLFGAAYDQSALVVFSGVLKATAISLSKIASDLRLLCSGPRAGIGELQLPAQQAGSSIMPGKVNPVIPEVVNQVCYALMGNDLTICMAADAGQLQLNAMEPVLLHRILDSLGLLENAVRTLRTRCIDGIEPNKERCQSLFENSLVLATELATHIGYERASAIAYEARRTDCKLADAIKNHPDIPEHILSILTGHRPECAV